MVFMSTKIVHLAEGRSNDLYGHMTITPAQCRAGRALIEWSQKDLADAAHVGLSTVRGFENGTRAPISNNLSAMRAALESAGVVLLGEFGVTTSADNFAEARLGA